jgi:hypothetical protein
VNAPSRVGLRARRIHRAAARSPQGGAAGPRGRRRSRRNSRIKTTRHTARARVPWPPPSSTVRAMGGSTMVLPQNNTVYEKRHGSAGRCGGCREGRDRRPRPGGHPGAWDAGRTADEEAAQSGVDPAVSARARCAATPFAVARWPGGAGGRAGDVPAYLPGGGSALAARRSGPRWGGAGGTAGGASSGSAAVCRGSPPATGDGTRTTRWRRGGISTGSRAGIASAARASRPQLQRSQ